MTGYDTHYITLTSPDDKEVDVTVEGVWYDEEDTGYKAYMITSWSPNLDWITEKMIDREIN